jgi:hypothetical protein
LTVPNILKDDPNLAPVRTLTAEARDRKSRVEHLDPNLEIDRTDTEDPRANMLHTDAWLTRDTPRTDKLEPKLAIAKQDTAEEAYTFFNIEIEDPNRATLRIDIPDPAKVEP